MPQYLVTLKKTITIPVEAEDVDDAASMAWLESGQGQQWIDASTDIDSVEEGEQNAPKSLSDKDLGRRPAAGRPNSFDSNDLRRKVFSFFSIDFRD